ncbi:hypothetical protein L195_g053481 [Trifolium pratense]|uniref:Uncharacterized protein n=1 Tax=Trifolium pratense TaxID=57577 RepID=A0A2K3KAU8_TRIPR|nr:hypothetical protein L195_g053481 [Trifolium pratense]
MTDDFFSDLSDKLIASLITLSRPEPKQGFRFGADFCVESVHTELCFDFNWALLVDGGIIPD